MSSQPQTWRRWIGQRLRWSGEGATLGLAAWLLGILTSRILLLLGW